MIPLATIGYESAPQARVIETLKAAGVEVLIDVRAVAASRRAGCSKGLLSSSLEDAGIEYVHLRALATPKAEMRAIFEAHLAEPEAQLQLARAIEIAKVKKAALLCYEADHRGCHRSIVVERMQEAADFSVENLQPSTL